MKRWSRPAIQRGSGEHAVDVPPRRCLKKWNRKIPRALALIDHLGLERHPEGGYYHSVYRSVSRVQPADDRPSRASLTTIYFLLASGQHSRWHRVRSDEAWHFYEGDPVELLVAIPNCCRLSAWRWAPWPAGVCRSTSSRPAGGRPHDLWALMGWSGARSPPASSSMTSRSSATTMRCFAPFGCWTLRWPISPETFVRPSAYESRQLRLNRRRSDERVTSSASSARTWSAPLVRTPR